MDIILGYAVGLIAIYVIAKILSVPIRIISKLVFNGIVGGITLLLVNIVGEYFGLYIAVTVLNALIAGFLGLPGVILLLILNN